jgi:hypothetical protein
MARKVGRPTKYNPDVMLPKLKALAERGAFLEAVPAELGITKETLHQWVNPESEYYQGKEFSDSIKEVEAGRDKWLADQLERHITGKSEGNSSALIFALKNTIGWRDRIETENKHEHKGDVSFTWGTE